MTTSSRIRVACIESQRSERLAGARVPSVVCVSRDPFEKHPQFCHCSTQDDNISTVQKIVFQRRCVDCGSEFEATDNIACCCPSASVVLDHRLFLRGWLLLWRHGAKLFKKVLPENFPAARLRCPSLGIPVFMGLLSVSNTGNCVYWVHPKKVTADKSAVLQVIGNMRTPKFFTVDFVGTGFHWDVVPLKMRCAPSRAFRVTAADSTFPQEHARSAQRGHLCEHVSVTVFLLGL